MSQPQTAHETSQVLTGNPGLIERLGIAAGFDASLVSGEVISLRKIKAETELFVISRVLERTQWNRKAAAKLLRISYRGLLYKIRQHKLTPTNGAMQEDCAVAGK